MGLGVSKPVESANNNNNASASAVPQGTSSSSSGGGSGGCPVKHEATTAAPAAAAETSKCPMHNPDDGSYSYDWRALFRPNFPHKPGGPAPLSSSSSSSSQKAAADKITRRASIQDATLASPAGGCPVTEYNVYGQKVDPKNNMPRMANQLPAAQQSQALSTERVKSSIPKVCVCASFAIAIVWECLFTGF